MGAHLRLAELAMSGGNFEEARAAFVVAISVGTHPAGARVRLAHCLLRLGDGDGARTQLAEERALPDFEARLADLATTPALALEATAVGVACKDFEFAQGVGTAALAAHPVDLQLLRRDCRISMEQGNCRSAYGRLGESCGPTRPTLKRCTTLLWRHSSCGDRVGLWLSFTAPAQPDFTSAHFERSAPACT